MDTEPSEIRKRIESAIREGLDQKYLDVVKALKKSYFADDIAAAAIALYAETGGSQGVRRRTLHNAPFVPLKTRETPPAGEKKKPTQHPAKPLAVRENVHGGHRGHRGHGEQGRSAGHAGQSKKQ